MSSYPPAWEQFESDVVAMTGGRHVRCSGRLPTDKGDVKTDAFVIDCKYTTMGRYTLTADMWRAVSEWARNESRIPAVAISFAGDAFVAVVPEYVYCQAHPEDDTGRVATKAAKSKVIRAQVERDWFVFQLGNTRLFAYALNAFCEDMRSVTPR